MSIQSPEVLCEKPEKVRDCLPVKSKEEHALSSTQKREGEQEARKLLTVLVYKKVLDPNHHW